MKLHQAIQGERRGGVGPGLSPKKALELGVKVIPPLFTEPGWNLHKADEIGIDDFQARRSPDEHYRTAPLRGLFTHTRGGFYHDGECIEHGEPSLCCVWFPESVVR